MFGTILKELATYISNNKFIVTYFLPTLIFSLIFIAMYVHTEDILPSALGIWNDFDPIVQAFLAVLFLSFVYLFAQVLNAFTGKLIRIYKGEWDRFARFYPLQLYRDYRKGSYITKFTKLNDDLDEIRKKIGGLFHEQAVLDTCLNFIEIMNLEYCPAEPKNSNIIVEIVLLEPGSVDEKDRKKTLPEIYEAIIQNPKNTEKKQEWEKNYKNLVKNLDHLNIDYRTSSNKAVHSKLGDRRKKIHENILAYECVAVEIYDEINFFYPPPQHKDSIMPTRLGNVLMSAELYPYERYRINPSVIWPRLYPLLTQEFLGPYTESQKAMESMIVISFLGLFFTVASSIYLVWTKGPVLTFIVAFTGGMVVWWTAYRSAIESAVAYGEMIKVAFDLYRDKLISALELKPPAWTPKESEIWDDLSQFFHHSLKVKNKFEYPVEPIKVSEEDTDG